MRHPLLVVCLALSMVLGVSAAPPATSPADAKQLAFSQAILADVPPQTLKLYERFQSDYTSPKVANARPELVTDLAAAPGGDLCFLDCAMIGGGTWPTITARAQVGTLDTQRTFDKTLSWIHSKDARVRANAVVVLSRFRRTQAIPPLLELLKGSDTFAGAVAARSLGDFNDARIEPALLDAAQGPRQMVANAALASLGRLKSPEGYPLMVDALDQSSPARDSAFGWVASYHNKAAAAVLVQKFVQIEKETSKPSKGTLRAMQFQLQRILAAAEPAVGPMPGPTADAWAAYWAKAEPLLNDNLELKEPTTRASKTAGK